MIPTRRALTIIQPDAESVEQYPRLIVAHLRRAIELTADVGFHSLALVAPYAIMFVAVGDNTKNISA